MERRLTRAFGTRGTRGCEKRWRVDLEVDLVDVRKNINKKHVTGTAYLAVTDPRKLEEEKEKQMCTYSASCSGHSAGLGRH